MSTSKILHNHTNFLYFGSLVWNEKTYHIFTDKSTIRYRYSLDMSDVQSYVSEGLIEVGVKTFLRKIKPDGIILPSYSQELFQVLNIRNPYELCKICEDSYLEKYYLEENKVLAYTYKGIRTERRPKAQSRKVFLPLEFDFKGCKYVGLEFKGCGCEGKGINFNKFRTIGDMRFDTGPEGGVYLDEIEKEIGMLEKLYHIGKKSPLGILGFELPWEVNSPNMGKKKLGLLLRGVRSSFRVSEAIDFGTDLLTQLQVSPQEFFEIFSSQLFDDLSKIFNAGFYHISPSDSNVHITGEITDLGVLEYIKNKENICFNLHNFIRVAQSLAKYLGKEINKEAIVLILNEKFRTKGKNIKEISYEISQSLK